jgi:hypothetical protein
MEHKPKNGHNYKRDAEVPEWHGWPARRGLGSNLCRLGVPEMVIQRILRHANASVVTLKPANGGHGKTGQRR